MVREPQYSTAARRSERTGIMSIACWSPTALKASVMRGSGGIGGAPRHHVADLAGEQRPERRAAQIHRHEIDCHRGADRAGRNDVLYGRVDQAVVGIQGGIGDGNQDQRGRGHARTRCQSRPAARRRRRRPPHTACGHPCGGGRCGRRSSRRRALRPLRRWRTRGRLRRRIRARLTWWIRLRNAGRNALIAYILKLSSAPEAIIHQIVGIFRIARMEAGLAILRDSAALANRFRQAQQQGNQDECRQPRRSPWRHASHRPVQSAR